MASANTFPIASEARPAAAPNAAMSYFPTFFALDGREVLVVGGGETAAQKLRLLLKAGARIRLDAREATDEIVALAGEDRIDRQQRGFVAGDVRGRALVVAASGVDELDVRVAEAARATG